MIYFELMEIMKRLAALFSLNERSPELSALAGCGPSPEAYGLDRFWASGGHRLAEHFAHMKLLFLIYMYVV